jgi:hypothetical protein
MRKSFMSVCFMALSMAACALATAAPTVHAGSPIAEAYSAQAKSEPMTFTVAASTQLEAVQVATRAKPEPAERMCSVATSTLPAFASTMTGTDAETQGSIRHSSDNHAHAA